MKLQLLRTKVIGKDWCIEASRDKVLRFQKKSHQGVAQEEGFYIGNKKKYAYDEYNVTLKKIL